MKTTIAHIISPFKAKEGSEPAIVQPITFESMRRAKKYASDTVDVELFTAQYPEDREIVPDYFTLTPDLERSIADIPSVGGSRKLPLLKDILDELYTHSEAEYFIYTNVDIGLMQPFYTVVDEYIQQGYDAFIINRRRVSGNYTSVDQLDLIYTDVGEMHNGFDCFVFKRALYEKFDVGEVCVGIPHVGNTLAHNLFCWGENFKLYTNQHLSFHIGMELVKKWGNDALMKHNYASFRKVLKKLTPHLRIENIPASGKPFIKRHFKWLMNPNLHYPTLFKLDFKQWGTQRAPSQREDSGQRYYEWLQEKVKLEE